MNDCTSRLTHVPSGGVLSSYMHSISAHGRVTPEEEAALARAWRESGCEKSRSQLITANLRLVISCARKYAGRGVPMDELVAEGNVGMVQAVDRFDPDAGCRLSTYAAFWIKQAIARAFAQAGRTGSIGRRDRAELAALTRTQNALFIARGQEPSAAETAAELGWSVDKTARLMDFRRVRYGQESLSEPGTVGRIGSAASSVEPRVSSVPEALESKSLAVALTTLKPDERLAIEAFYGLSGGEGRSLRAVAETLGRTPRSTRTLLRVAISKLGRSRAWSGSNDGSVPHLDEAA